jgi:hypothetical protein
MANRILRDWTQSENVNNLSPAAEVFFTRLIMKVDDYGCYYGNVKLLKAALYPLKDFKPEDLTKLINECKKNNLVTVYVVENKQYIIINNFGQRLRQMKKRFPLPSDGDTLTNDGDTLTIGSNPPLETETETEKKPKKEIKIPEFEEFKIYALTKKQNVCLESLKLKYDSWFANGWKNGNDKKIVNWQSTLLNTLPYIKTKDTQQQTTNYTLKLGKHETG